MNRKGFAAIASLSTFAALLIVPAAASATAAPVYLYAGKTLAVGLNETTTFPAIAGDPTPHTITVSYSAGTYSVTDTSGATAGTGCAQAGPTSVSCADTGLTGVSVFGGGGPDTLKIASVGPTATDTEIDGFKGNDVMTTPATTDSLYGGDGDDTMDGGLGPDLMDGGRGSDTASYATRGASEPVTVVIDVSTGDPDTDLAPVPDGAPGEGDSVDAENAIGGAGNDTFVGPKGGGALKQDVGAANAFTGGAGNDRLLGGGGPDRLSGGIGNDTLLGGASKDRLDGGAGKDRCVGGPSKDKAKKCEKKASI
jgi:Ca2+-binding RTX toxin-like protein